LKKVKSNYDDYRGAYDWLPSTQNCNKNLGNLTNNDDNNKRDEK